jgi:hypothetical protein
MRRSRTSYLQSQQDYLIDDVSNVNSNPAPTSSQAKELSRCNLATTFAGLHCKTEIDLRTCPGQSKQEEAITKLHEQRKSRRASMKAFPGSLGPWSRGAQTSTANPRIEKCKDCVAGAGR